jgi:hypothetical protein
MRRLSAVFIVLSLLHQPALAQSDEEMVAFASDALIFGDDEEAAAAVSYLAERGQADAAAAAIRRCATARCAAPSSWRCSKA